MPPINVLTIFGTRPEVIKLYPVLDQIGRRPECRNIIVSTSQHREMIADLLTLFSISPDHDLNIMRKNQSLVDISNRALSGLDSLLKEHKPELVLVQGDTTTAFIGALAAFYHKIPVGHVEAGLRSFNKMHPYPEEINRRLISQVTDLHFAPTAGNANNLKSEGTDASSIFVTGNTVIDSLLFVASRNRNTLQRFLPAWALNSHRQILVTAHRRENWGKPLEDLCLALKDIVRFHEDVQVIYPVHLNPNVRATVFPILEGQERIVLTDPLPYEPFVEAMTMADFIITDSGGIQEEGPSLKKPILVFRQVTERPEGIAGGGVKLVGLQRDALVSEATLLLKSPEARRKMEAAYNPYGDGKAGYRIARAILHYFNVSDKPEDFITPTGTTH